ncbi:MAG: SPFH domain-containing protein, partial [Xanthomonadales bacterium]|nr:SPFH domain-containing protein [Xanthomonadales bacterium]
MNERKAISLPGIPVLLVLIAAMIANAAWFIDTVRTSAESRINPGFGQIFGPVLVMVLLIFLLKGLFAVQPNVGRVMQLFGRYAGSVREQGLRWTNP